MRCRRDGGPYSYPLLCEEDRRGPGGRNGRWKRSGRADQDPERTLRRGRACKVRCRWKTRDCRLLWNGLGGRTTNTKQSMANDRIHRARRLRVYSPSPPRARITETEREREPESPAHTWCNTRRHLSVASLPSSLVGNESLDGSTIDSLLSCRTPPRTQERLPTQPPTPPPPDTRLPLRTCSTLSATHTSCTPSIYSRQNRTLRY